ncbi:UNVERIFIED_CONTAM: hypothetical protein K2H54_062394 [Gekko kuhli]
MNPKESVWQLWLSQEICGRGASPLLSQTQAKQPDICRLHRLHLAGKLAASAPSRSLLFHQEGSCRAAKKAGGKEDSGGGEGLGRKGSRADQKGTEGLGPSWNRGWIRGKDPSGRFSPLAPGGLWDACV